MNFKVYLVAGLALILAGCTQATAPKHDTDPCRSGYNVSSGKDSTCVQ